MKSGICAALFYALAIALSGPASAGKADDTLNVGWERGLESLDLYFSTAREAIIVSRLLYDTLIDRDPVSSAYRPLLAKSFKFVGDKTIDIELREDVLFHNGEKMDADDVVYTLNWVAKPENGVIHQQNVSWIDHVEKTSKYGVRLVMKAPFPAALEFLSGPLPIYPKSYYQSVGPKGMGTKPIGTGPYKLAELSAGSRIVLERNPAYFKGGPKGSPAIKRIVQRSIPELNTQMIELINGQLDWAWKLPSEQAAKLGSGRNVKVVEAPTMRVGYMQFDVVGRSGKTPLSDVRVRRAIAHAIDRQTIATSLIGGGAKQVDAFCFPSQIGCTDSVTRYGYDPQKSRELLKEAGYPDGFAIDFNSYGDRRVIEAIMRYLSAVNIKAKAAITTFEPLRDKVSEGKIAMNFMGWGSNSINDVSAILPNFFNLGSNDYARDEHVAGLIKTAGTTTNPAARNALYQQALQKIATEVYVLPMFSYSVNYAMASDLDFAPSADEIPRLYLAKWK